MSAENRHRRIRGCGGDRVSRERASRDLLEVVACARKQRSVHATRYSSGVLSARSTATGRGVSHLWPPLPRASDQRRHGRSRIASLSLNKGALRQHGRFRLEPRDYATRALDAEWRSHYGFSLDHRPEVPEAGSTEREEAGCSIARDRDGCAVALSYPMKRMREIVLRGERAVSKACTGSFAQIWSVRSTSCTVRD